MNRFHPFVILLSCLAASSMLLAQSGSTFPVNGTPDAQAELHAYEGARVHLSADEGSENGGGDLSMKENVIEVLKIQEGDLDSEKCIICLEKEKEMAFYPCGH